MVPETIVVDHGKIYVSEHLTSVCRRLGISIQPARLPTGRDKGPVERFFRTLREDLLQALPGYKGPDIHARGADPEAEAFFFLDELEVIIREWTATVYHHRPHASLLDPHLPEIAPDRGGIGLTPAGEEFAQEVIPVLAMLARKGHDAAITPRRSPPFLVRVPEDALDPLCFGKGMEERGTGGPGCMRCVTGSGLAGLHGLPRCSAGGEHGPDGLDDHYSPVSWRRSRRAQSSIRPTA
ncbi:MAG: hypothetical protein ACRDQ5_23485 [Sciscionella sp.]